MQPGAQFHSISIPLQMETAQRRKRKTKLEMFLELSQRTPQAEKAQKVQNLQNLIQKFEDLLETQKSRGNPKIDLLCLELLNLQKELSKAVLAQNDPIIRQEHFCPSLQPVSDTVLLVDSQGESVKVQMKAVFIWVQNDKVEENILETGRKMRSSNIINEKKQDENGDSLDFLFKLSPVQEVNYLQVDKLLSEIQVNKNEIENLNNEILLSKSNQIPKYVEIDHVFLTQIREKQQNQAQDKLPVLKQNANVSRIQMLENERRSQIQKELQRNAENLKNQVKIQPKDYNEIVHKQSSDCQGMSKYAQMTQKLVKNEQETKKIEAKNDSVSKVVQSTKIDSTKQIQTKTEKKEDDFDDQEFDEEEKIEQKKEKLPELNKNAHVNENFRNAQVNKSQAEPASKQQQLPQAKSSANVTVKTIQQSIQNQQSTKTTEKNQPTIVETQENNDDFDNDQFDDDEEVKQIRKAQLPLVTPNIKAHTSNNQCTVSQLSPSAFNKQDTENKADIKAKEITKQDGEQDQDVQIDLGDENMDVFRKKDENVWGNDDVDNSSKAKKNCDFDCNQTKKNGNNDDDFDDASAQQDTALKNPVVQQKTNQKQAAEEADDDFDDEPAHSTQKVQKPNNLEQNTAIVSQANQKLFTINQILPKIQEKKDVNLFDDIGGFDFGEKKGGNADFDF